MKQQYKHLPLAKEDGKRYLDKCWNEVQNRVLTALWNKHKHKYQSVGLEFGDFINIAYIILADEASKYNADKSKFCTFAQMVVSKRMFSYIRTISERNKTKLSVYHESLDAPVSSDTDMLLEDIIQDEETEDNTDCKKVRQYLSNLCRTQKDILIYHLLGIPQDEIISEGGISEKQYRFAISSMKMPEKISMFNLKGRLK